MHRAIVFAAFVAAIALVPATASAHEGGHRGGCEDFGHINHDIAQDPSAFGFPGYRNLGQIVSDFAHDETSAPGVGDVVENVDHLACGEG